MTQEKIKRPRGRPPAPERPRPLSWRPKSDEIKDQFVSNGASRWLNALLQQQLTEKQRKG
jgi:hypothetical protein